MFAGASLANNIVCLDSRLSMSDSLASIYVVFNILKRQTVVPHVLRDESRSDEHYAFLSAYINFLK